MSIYTDPQQVTTGSIESVDAAGVSFDAEDSVIVPVIVTDAATLVSGHSVGDSVDATTAQTIARAVLDALAVFSP